MCRALLSSQLVQVLRNCFAGALSKHEIIGCAHWREPSDLVPGILVVWSGSIRLDHLLDEHVLELADLLMLLDLLAERNT